MFVDESGDPGFPKDGDWSKFGGSKFFVRVGVIIHGWKWKAWHRQMLNFKDNRGLLWSAEIKANHIRRGKGALTGWEEKRRLAFAEDFAKLIGFNREITLIGVAIDKTKVNPASRDRITRPEVRSLELLQLPLQLLVEKNSDIKSAEQLWQRDKIGESLICLPASESVTRSFLKQLAKRGVEWFPSIEASSLDLIETYVANGLGVGMSVAVPKKPLPENVRALPLPEFPPLVIGALWRGKATPLLEMFLSEAKLRARELS